MKKDNKALSMTFTALKVIGVAGALAIMMVCPNMAQIFSMFGPGKTAKRFYPSKANETVRRLRDNGSIEIVKHNGIPCYSLTDKGRHILSQFELKNSTIDVPKKWDKKWRMVIFDVREKRRRCRDAIRRTLQQLNFQYLQNSVWIHPYPCKEVIELARTAYGIRYDVKYIICLQFDGDERYARRFGLSTD